MKTKSIQYMSIVMRKVLAVNFSICLILLGINHRLSAQGTNIIYGADGANKHFLVGNLGYTSTAVKEKLKVEVFGGAWHNFNLGEKTYYISTRDGIKINSETHGGSTGRFELKVFDNGSSYDFVIRLTTTYPAIQIKSWILKGGASYGQYFETEFGVVSYDPSGKTDITSQIAVNELIVTTNGGNVGIGEASPDHKLSVNGTVGAKEVKVTSSGWSDFVFGPDYDLKSLDQVEDFIRENGHLPDIPSAEEVEENGISLGEMDARLLQKIEELTLYVIEQGKELNELKKENEKQANEIERLNTRLNTK